MKERIIIACVVGILAGFAAGYFFPKQQAVVSQQIPTTEAVVVHQTPTEQVLVGKQYFECDNDVNFSAIIYLPDTHRTLGFPDGRTIEVWRNDTDPKDHYLSDDKKTEFYDVPVNAFIFENGKNTFSGCWVNEKLTENRYGI